MKLGRHRDRACWAMIAQHLGVDLIDRGPIGYVGDIDGNAHEFVEPRASRPKDVADVLQSLAGRASIPTGTLPWLSATKGSCPATNTKPLATTAWL